MENFHCRLKDVSLPDETIPDDDFELRLELLLVFLHWTALLRMQPVH